MGSSTITPHCTHETVEGVAVLGDNRTLVQLAQSLRINEIILAITNTQEISDDMLEALLQCRELGYRVVTMATIYERMTGRVAIDFVGRDLQMVLPMEDRAGERAFRLAKRGIDVLVSLCRPVCDGRFPRSRLRS